MCMVLLTADLVDDRWLDRRRCLAADGYVSYARKGEVKGPSYLIQSERLRV